MSLDEQIDIDRVRALYATAPMASGIGVFAGALWVLVFAGPAGLAIVGFYALVLANQGTRIALWRRQRAEPDDPRRARIWARRYTLTMLSGGLIWGLGSVLFFPADDPARQVFILVAAFGISSGATAPNAYHPPALIAFLLATLLPVLGRVFAEGGLVYGVIGVALTMQIILMILFGLAMSKQLRASIRMRYENDGLIEQLREKTEIAEAAQRKAEQASIAKSHFFAAASHDLRQPMQALGLYAASLREVRREPEDARKIDQILSSVDALESLFDELLDISKLDAGYVQPSASHFAARALFERLEAAYAPIARKSRLELKFQPTDAVLHSDAVLLERVLGNLIANGLRYTEAGGVTVACDPRGVISVEDTGIGIPEAEREKVFDEFYQLDNPERDRRKGLGLGLATVRRITDLLGTPLRLASEVGRGTRFTLQVPLGDPARAAERPAAPRAAELDALAGRRVLVIEDEASVREGLVQLLRDWHCDVVAASSAREAIGLLERAPEAIVADYRLREGSTGIGAVSELRERFGRQLPAILVTGDTAPEIFAAARASALPLLTKPVRAARLRAALTHLLSFSGVPTGIRTPVLTVKG